MNKENIPSNGQEIKDEIDRQTEAWIKMCFTPEFLIIGSYAYYLLKDLLIKEREANGEVVNRYHEYQSVESNGLILKLCFHPRSEGGGPYEDTHHFVGVYATPSS